MRVLLAVLAILGFGLAGPALAADRPAKTETSALVPPGSLRLAIGYERAEGARDLAFRAAVAAVTAGLSASTDLTLEGSYLRRAEPAQPAATGWGDPTVTVRTRLAAERGRRPEVTLALGAKLPSGDHERGLGTEETDFLACLHLARRARRASVHLNLGFTIVGLVERPHEQEDSFLWGVAAEVPLARRARLVGDLFGEHLRNVRRNPFSYLEDYDQALLVGLRFDAAGAVWDAGLFRPVLGGGEGWGVTVGVTRLVRFGGAAPAAAYAR